MVKTWKSFHFRVQSFRLEKFIVIEYISCNTDISLLFSIHSERSESFCWLFNHFWSQKTRGIKLLMWGSKVDSSTGFELKTLVRLLIPSIMCDVKRHIIDIVPYSFSHTLLMTSPQPRGYKSFSRVSLKLYFLVRPIFIRQTPSQTSCSFCLKVYDIVELRPCSHHIET